MKYPAIFLTTNLYIDMINTNPFNVSDCFLPMFTDIIGYELIRANGTTLTQYNASIFPISDEEPFADFDVETPVKKMNVLIMKNVENGWNNKKDKPQIGDIIILDDSTKWKVSNVNYNSSWFDLKVRNI